VQNVSWRILFSRDAKHVEVREHLGHIHASIPPRIAFYLLARGERSGGEASILAGRRPSHNKTCAVVMRSPHRLHAASMRLPPYLTGERAKGARKIKRTFVLTDAAG
jgi:hypothetical protein